MEGQITSGNAEKQEGEERGRKCKAVNPVDAALAKKKKVTLSADTVECKYCGKVYHTGKKLMDHINQEHSSEQNYLCLSILYTTI